MAFVGGLFVGLAIGVLAGALWTSMLVRRDTDDYL